jgi:hypothetical protein
LQEVSVGEFGVPATQSFTIWPFTHSRVPKLRQTPWPHTEGWGRKSSSVWKSQSSSTPLQPSPRPGWMAGFPSLQSPARVIQPCVPGSPLQVVSPATVSP